MLLRSVVEVSVTELVRGQVIGRSLRLLEQLGAGGMGSVWVAEHIGLRTHVAVKFMARELVHDQESNARFAREASAASSVKSPHVVQMLDYGLTDDGIAYIVMELLEGRDLARRIREHGPLDAEEVVQIVEQVAAALDRAHARNVIHRDIKPENIFLCDVGGDAPFVKILDFGVAKETRNVFGTFAGELLGTPAYMSPEQLEGASTVDARTDLWSLGVVVYEALTGVHAFDGASIAEVIKRIHVDPLPAPTRAMPDLPRAVDEWFFHACARRPNMRFASAREMARALGIALQVRAPRDSGRTRALEPTPSLPHSASFEPDFGLPRQRSSVAWLALAVAALSLGIVLFPMAKKRMPHASVAPAPSHVATAFGGGAPATSDDEPERTPPLRVPLPPVASTSPVTPASVSATPDAAVAESGQIRLVPAPAKQATAPKPATDAAVSGATDGGPKSDAGEGAPSASAATDAGIELKFPPDASIENDNPYGTDD